MLIDVRKPQIKVVLRKNVGRKTIDASAPVSERYAGQLPTVDLTPFLGEGASVRVSKSLRQPAGAFSINVPDQLDRDLLDSLYSAVEPMDLIEIRVSGRGFDPDARAPSMVCDATTYGIQSTPVDPAEGFPPVMMRGFVSSIERMEGMGADGRPSRRVVISGQDYGKILQMNQLFNLPNAPDTANMATGLPFYARFGNAQQSSEAGSFVRDVFTLIVNKAIERMLDKSRSWIQPFSLDIQVTGAMVSPFGTGGWGGGTITDLIRSFCDIGPFNEFFVEDRADGPWAVYRPNPFMDAVTRKFIQPFNATIGVTDLDRRDVISMTSSRSDANVANYYWVASPRFDTNYDWQSRAAEFQSAQAAKSAPYIVQDYGNVDPVLYGWRKMEEATQQNGFEENNSGNGLKADDQQAKQKLSALDWISARRGVLFAQNKDNVVLETGSMRVKGNESIRAGTYVRLAHGSMKSLYYVVSVQHDFSPFGNFLTEFQFERGTGFVDRIQAAAGNAYWDELVVKK
jgi:hypothetical protein